MSNAELELRKVKLFFMLCFLEIINHGEKEKLCDSLCTLWKKKHAKMCQNKNKEFSTTENTIK